MHTARRIASQVEIKSAQVAAAIELFDQGNTLPFIARYRKEATGGLDEDQLRRILEALGRLRALDERRETILRSIEQQGVLSTDLKKQIEAAESRSLLEDLYQPYKPKRQTRASTARARGLEPLAVRMISQQVGALSAEQIAADFLGVEVPDAAAALEGARAIVAETISDDLQVRSETRKRSFQRGQLRMAKSAKAEDPRGTYASYYDNQLRIDRLKPHQVLAINRGEKEATLRVGLEVADREWKESIDQQYPANPRSAFADQFEAAKEEAARRLLLPSIERDIRRELTARAEKHAIKTFAENLKALLTLPPLSGVTILGIDPGYRTGCKLAVVDPTGKVLETGTMYPHAPQNEAESARQLLLDWVARHSIKIIAIGNGTASRETEHLVAGLASHDEALQYMITNEAGASVYSASKLAAAELPDLDVSLRGAVSIARRVQDPLAELVKIDPQSIGVGLYQHDVNQTELSQTLKNVVESVVNAVGVDVNTASPALLTHVAGIGPSLAEKIVLYREEQGAFQQRSELLNVPGLGKKAYEQAAGFLRIRQGANPLDATAIHPESYPVARKLLQLAGITPGLPQNDQAAALDRLLTAIPLASLAAELGAGEPTIVDILEQLREPGRDPRLSAPPPLLRSDVLSVEDLKPGLRLKGTVRNVVDFGAFVDIGVKQDGLLHRSRIPRGRQLKVGDVIEVAVRSVDLERGRIALEIDAD